jgi:exodeoxyribonuclease V alpha subunit
LEVPGIGMKRLPLIRQAWIEHASSREAMLFRHRYDITGSTARWIFKEHGHKTIVIVQSDPYQLARNVARIGFLTTDRIATDVGMASTSPRRLRAGVIHVLQEASKNGHLFLPEKQLIRQMNGALRTSHSPGIADAIEAEVQEGTLTRCPARPNSESPGVPAPAEDSIYLTYLQRAEVKEAALTIVFTLGPASLARDRTHS